MSQIFDARRKPIPLDLPEPLPLPSSTDLAVMGQARNQAHRLVEHDRRRSRRRPTQRRPRRTEDAMNKRADLAAQAMTPEWPTRSEDFKRIRRHQARKALAAADQVMFSNANIARIVKATELSIQTVNEVIRELRNEHG